MMNQSWIKPNSFVIKDGKLVPRNTTPQQKKNYKYIPYDPLNNPTPEDYFRETIFRLQKENQNLRAQLAQKIQAIQSRNHLVTPDQALRRCQEEIKMLLMQLSRKQQELAEKNKELLQKDKHILELSNENSRLHLRINAVTKQMDSVSALMSKKDLEILAKKEQIEEYIRALQKTQKEKEQENTVVSENYLTPKISQKQEADQFYSIECNSMNDYHSNTPKYIANHSQNYFIDDSHSYLYRSQGQKDNFLSARVTKTNPNQQKSPGNLYENLLNWSQWGSQNNYKGSLSFELMKD